MNVNVAVRESQGFRIYVALLCATVFFLAFQTAISAFVPVFQFFDEAVLLVAVALIARHVISMRLPRIEGYVILLIGYLFLVSLFFGRAESLVNEIAQIFIHVKFFLLYVLIRPLLTSPAALTRVEKMLLLTGALTLAGIALSFLMPALFQETIGGSAISRFGMVRATGFQVKPNDAALFLSPILLLLVLRAALTRSSGQVLLLFLAATFVFFANTSRISALTIPLSAFLLLFIGRSSRAVNLVLGMLVVLLTPMLLLLPFMQEVVGHTMQNLTQFGRMDETEYIRAIMVYYSGVLALDYFPIGSGAATYGSALSEGSVVYAELGMYSIALVDKFSGVFDSNLATLLGEFGVIGIALFVALTVFTFRDMRKVMGCTDHRALIYHRVVLGFLLLVAAVNPLYMYSLTSISFLLAAVLGARMFSRHTR